MGPRPLIRGTLSAALLLTALLASGNGAAPDPATLSAGPFTTSETGANAFSVPVALLDREQAGQFALGREQFNEAWVVAPDPAGVWGLGPTFNEDRCAHCHAHNGRAPAPEHGGRAERGLLVRLSVPGAGGAGSPDPHPAYGDQLQNRGVAGRVPAEGQALIEYETREVRFADGERLQLRKPKVRFSELQFGPLGAETQVSLRIAPALVGLGLLEAVPEETILEIARQQPMRGLSGRPNYVRDVEHGSTVLGRFGWKAGQPHLRQQTAAAFHGDIGATTYLFPEENCPDVQLACLDLPSASKCGGQGGCTGNNYRPEVTPSRLTNITLYLQALAVPARRNPEDPAVKRGELLFSQAGCADCHVPRLRTGMHAALPAAANLEIRAYTDLLLHDMGEELADDRPEFLADGREWRTPPLWGIGLLPAVNGHSDLLHDGRARGVVEAILWHGGEAQAAREAFMQMPKPQREAMVKFVESL